jgi:hypothetical protein
MIPRRTSLGYLEERYLFAVCKLDLKGVPLSSTNISSKDQGGIRPRVLHLSSCVEKVKGFEECFFYYVAKPPVP